MSRALLYSLSLSGSLFLLLALEISRALSLSICFLFLSLFLPIYSHDMFHPLQKALYANFDYVSESAEQHELKMSVGRLLDGHIIVKQSSKSTCCCFG
jgi:hypothetical protein